MKRFLVLDSQHEKHNGFDDILREHFRVHVYNFSDCVGVIQDQSPFDIMFLGFDLNSLGKDSIASQIMHGRETSGIDVANYVAFKLPVEKQPYMVVVHSANVDGSKRMVEVLKEAGIRVTHSPFNLLLFKEQVPTWIKETR